MSLKIITKYCFFVAINVHVDYRHEATEYMQRKRRLLPVDYAETKRRKQNKCVSRDKDADIQIKLERIDLMQTSIGLLNERIGVELISDD